METAELLSQIQKVADLDPDELTDRELFDDVVKFERLIGALTAKAIPLQAAAIERKAHRVRKYRSAATGMANETRLSARTCGGHFNQATLLVNDLARVYTAYAAGVLNADQVRLICRHATPKSHRKYATRDQTTFIDWADNPWPIFVALMNRWAEVVDDSDPQNEDDKAFADRRLIWGYGVGKTVLVEWDLPTQIWEELLAIATPTYDALLKAELADAKAEHGQDVEFRDLARTDRQRWSDAFVTVIRRGGTVGTRLAAKHAAANDNPEGAIGPDDEGFDPGVRAEVIILCDASTLQRQIARRAGQSLPPRPPSDAQTYICETLSGMPVTPATALAYLELNHFRRMTLKPGTIDFELTKKARYFLGPKRLGLIARDRTCQGPGCGTPAKNCQGDHIVPYHQNGPTVPTNGEMLCGPCHRHKTWLQAHGMWTKVAQSPSRRHKPSGQEEPHNSDKWAA